MSSHALKPTQAFILATVSSGKSRNMYAPITRLTAVLLDEHSVAVTDREGNRVIFDQPIPVEEADSKEVYSWTNGFAVNRSCTRTDAIRAVLMAFNQWFEEHQVGKVWSHGACDSIVRLQLLYDSLPAAAGASDKTFTYPWNWFNVRDTRTLLDMAHVRTNLPLPPDPIDQCFFRINLLNDAIFSLGCSWEEGSEGELD